MPTSPTLPIPASSLRQERKHGFASVLSDLFSGSSQAHATQSALRAYEEVLREFAVKHKQWLRDVTTISKRKLAEIVWKQMHRKAPPGHLDSMTGGEFETFLFKYFAGRGFRVSATAGGADQGADLILIDADDRKIAVQAKRHSRIVGNRAVQELLGAMAYYHCECGIVVTTAYFSKSAVALAKRATGISLWDCEKLAEALVSRTSKPSFNQLAYERLVTHYRPRRPKEGDLSFAAYFYPGYPPAIGQCKRLISDTPGLDIDPAVLLEIADRLWKAGYVVFSWRGMQNLIAPQLWQTQKARAKRAGAPHDSA
jgi:HJR/Mrr/RecB family endonuclease